MTSTLKGRGGQKIQNFCRGHKWKLPKCDLYLTLEPHFGTQIELGKVLLLGLGSHGGQVKRARRAMRHRRHIKLSSR